MSRFRSRSRLALPLAALVGVVPLVLLPGSAAQAVVSNKLVNPGFESGNLNGWETWSVADADADFAEGPSKLGSYKGVHRKSSAYEVYTYQRVTGLAGGTYAVSASFRSSGGQQFTNFTAKIPGGATTTRAIPMPEAGKTGQWDRLQLPDVTISSGQEIEVGIYSKGPGGTWLFFDDVRLDFIAPNPAQTTEGPNLVSNPGFETSLNWSNSGTATRVVDNANSESASMRLGPTSGFTYQDITSGFLPGQTVVLTGYGKSPAQGGVALLGVQALNGSNTVLWDAKTPFFAADYGKNSTTSVLPAGTTKLRVYIYKEDGDRTSEVYVDDVRLYVSSGTTFYVDPSSTSSDNNPGTSPTQAWRTLGRANQRVWAPGDTLLLKGGSTFTGGLDFGSASSGTLNHPITISSYGTGGRATINALTQNGILLQDASGFHIYNLDLTGPGVTTGVYEGIFATNQTASTQRGLVGIDNVTVSGFYLGINLNSRRGKGFGPINILNSTTRDNFREGTNIFGYDSAGEEGEKWYSQGIFTRAYIGYVTSYNNQEWSGILIANTDEAMIEHSTAYDIGETAVGNQGPVGIWTFGTKRGTVQFNSSSDVGSSNKSPGRDGDKLDGDGYDVSHNNTDALYQYNLAFNNEGPGFLSDNANQDSPDSDKVTLRYNISHGNCRDNNFCGEFYVYGPNPEIDIHHNSIRATRPGQAGMRFTGEWGGTGPVTGSRDTKVRNNIISVVTGAPAVHITAPGEGGEDFEWTDAQAGNITFQGNLYWADGGGSLNFWDAGTTHSSLAQWRDSGRERIGTTNTGIHADPLFANPNPTTLGSADHLKIGASSPARNAGLNLPSQFNTPVGAIDYFGTTLPQGSAYDIGEHERS